MDIAEIAESCKKVAFSIAGVHPYAVADSMASALEGSLVKADVAYTIKRHIYEHTDRRSVIWHLPKPDMPTFFSELPQPHPTLRDA